MEISTRPGRSWKKLTQNAAVDGTTGRLSVHSGATNSRDAVTALVFGPKVSGRAGGITFSAALRGANGTTSRMDRPYSGGVSRLASRCAVNHSATVLGALLGGRTT